MVAKVAAHVIPVTVSTVLVVMFGSLAPPLVAWLILLLGPAITVALLCGVGERQVCQLLGGRDLTPTERDFLAPTVTILSQHRLGPPLVELVAHDRPGEGVDATAFGRRTVLISADLLTAARHRTLPPQELAAVIGHAAGIVRSGSRRCDLALQFWTSPWLLLTIVALGVTHALRFLGRILAAAWAIRYIVAAVAVVQAVNEGHLIVGALVAATVLATSVHPRCVRAWRRQLEDRGDVAVANAGLGNAMATFLRRYPPTARRDHRIYQLDAATPPPARPQLRVVS